MFGLGYAVDGEMSGRLSIPYFTPHGVVQIKYRCTNFNHGRNGDHKESSCPKYLYEAGCGSHLFNARALIGASDQVVLCEGELDAICVQAYCGIPAVGYPGADSWSKGKHYPLCFEGVGEVVVVADGDDVGRNAASRVEESLNRRGIVARVIDLGDGQDANSFIASQGAPSFLNRISE